MEQHLNINAATAIRHALSLVDVNQREDTSRALLQLIEALMQRGVRLDPFTEERIKQLRAIQGLVPSTEFVIRDYAEPDTPLPEAGVDVFQMHIAPTTPVTFWWQWVESSMRLWGFMK